jgi:outer membrane receptor for ferrienterochelin and colicins
MLMLPVKKELFTAMLAVGLISNVALAQEQSKEEEQEQSSAQKVVITATLREHTIAAAPAFTTVITAAEIAKSPINSIGDLLRETVGVNNSLDTSGRDQIQIRGLAGQYTLMLVNGKRLSSSGALWRGGDFDFSSVPLNSIQRIEIVRGPMAALYGSDAIGGVVNIITKKPSKQWNTSVSAEYRHIATGDQGQQTRLGVATSGAFDDQLSLSVAGEIYNREAWYSTSASDLTRPARLEGKESKNVSGTATLKLSESQTVELDLAYNDDQRPRAMYYYEYNPKTKTETRDIGEQAIQRLTYGVSHKANWGWGSSTAFISREQTEIDDYNTRYKAPLQRNPKENNTYAKLYASTDLTVHALTAGIDLRSQTIEDKFTYLKTGKITTRSAALFAEDEITLAKNLHLTLAGRFDNNTHFGNHFTPKTYLSYQPNATVTIKGGINKAFKAPSSYQVSKEYSVISCGGRCTLTGNPNLTPEKSTNVELGFEVHEKNWNISVVGFKNVVDSMIIAYYDPQLLARRWVNIAKANTHGLEVQADVNLTPTVSLNGNMTHLSAKYTNERGVQTNLDNRPSNIAHLSLQWKILSSLSASLSANYVGKQTYESKPLPAYTRMDMNLSAQLQKNLIARFGVKNLSNVNLESKSKDFTFFELGRNFYVSGSYSF